MNKRLRRLSRITYILLCVALALVGLSFGSEGWFTIDTAAQRTQKPSGPATANERTNKKPLSDHSRGTTANPTVTRSTEAPGDLGMAERSPAAYDPNWDRDYPQDQRRKLQPFPDLRPGDIPPVKLYLYGGPGKSSFASIDDVADFNEFYDRLSKQKSAVMARWKAYLDTRYSF